jgi:dTDP-4-dehydrorhamnose reductase
VRRILIVGENGEIADDLRRHFSAENYVSFTSRRRSPNSFELDLQYADTIENLRLPFFDFIVFASGITGGANCANNRELSHLVNVVNTKRALERLSLCAEKVYFLSSSLCFYAQTNNFGLAQIYVDQKRQIENYINENLANVYILRPSKVIGCNNVRMKQWIKSFLRQESVHAPSNIFTSPLRTSFLANSIMSHFDSSSQRILHLSSRELISISDFAKMIMQKMQLDGFVKSINAPHSFRGDDESFIARSITDSRNLSVELENISLTVEDFFSHRKGFYD